MQNTYIERIKHFDTLLKKEKNIRTIFLISKLLTFISAIVFLYRYVGFGTHLIDILLFVAFIIIFLVLTTLDSRLERRYKLQLFLKKINEIEVECLNRNYIQLPDGLNFIDQNHSYAYDLDIFGRKSIFQVINRTSIAEGTNKLASMLLTPLKDKAEIIDRQKAIAELSELINFRQNFQAIGNSNELQNKLFPAQSVDTKSFKTSKLIFFFAWILPFFTIPSFILYALDLINSILPITLGSVQLIAAGIYGHQSFKVYKTISGLSKALFAYSDLLQTIQNQKFKSEKLKKHYQTLFEGNHNAHQGFKDLAHILSAFDQRANIIILFAGNLLISRDLHLIIRFNKWQNNYETLINQWIETIAELDALCSFANFSYNNPEYIFPEIQENTPISATELAHPLIDKQKRVANDFTITNTKEYFIITGANMAGKSTFLRTVGVNFVLACAGSPVCAKTFRFQPSNLFTSMRTTDNLAENTSYFHAELLRLSKLKEQAETLEPTLVILDEILKGTNSKDKLTGSKLFLQKLIEYNTFGIVATHDLELGILENEYPNNFKNICFEIVFENDDVRYDYLLKKGITTNLNATFLLHKMNLV
jgi:DNA mismatch repair ATPase MutS